MAGLVARLFGGRQRPPDPDPLPGQGGYALGPGPYGATGFPGSTSAAPRAYPQDTQAAKLPDRHGVPTRGTEVRQVSSRGDIGRPSASPRATPRLRLPRSGAAEELQREPAEFYGGPMLRTVPGANDTAGANPLGRDGLPQHSVRDTETPMASRQPQIGVGTPGASNVRNEVTQRYKARPGEMHTYRSAPRGELTAAGGGPGPDQGMTEVTVPSRFVFAGGGNQTWVMDRRMPYTGPGNGSRGAHLNGTRYYGTGQEDQFLNGGAGQYGYRAAGRGGGPKRPVSYTEPAPWTSGFYDTNTDQADAGQGPAGPRVHVSPSGGRASNRTGRTG